MNKTHNIKPEDIVSGKLFELLDFKGTNDQNPVSFRNQLTGIYNFVKKQEFVHTLEVGMGIGGSAVHILAATAGQHVAMDPVQLVSYNNIGLNNVRKFGLESKLEFYNECSEFVLPELLNQNRKFEFIYIDGDHKFDFALIDFYFCDFLLATNGFILLDDAWMPSIVRVSDFISMNRSNYYFCDPIYDGSILLKKMFNQQDVGVFRKF